MQPRVTDNDKGEITVSLDGRELRGWSYKDEAERRQKMLQAREYVEGWLEALAKAPSAEFSVQAYGATVATIHETEDGLLEIVDMKDGTFNLVVHQRIGETDRFDDLSIRLRPEHFAKLGSIR